MKTVWAKQPIPTDIPSIFLAGPTPRSGDVKSWRPEAIQTFRNLGFTGAILAPEPEGALGEGGTGTWCHTYMDQVEWEDEALNQATVILFWVPRDLEKMPAFTTNIEWGTWHRSGKVVLGAPEEAPKMKYMRYYADKLSIPSHFSLEDTCRSAICLAEHEWEMGLSKPLYDPRLCRPDGGRDGSGMNM